MWRSHSHRSYQHDLSLTDISMLPPVEQFFQNKFISIDTSEHKQELSRTRYISIIQNKVHLYSVHLYSWYIRTQTRAQDKIHLHWCIKNAHESCLEQKSSLFLIRQNKCKSCPGQDGSLSMSQNSHETPSLSWCQHGILDSCAGQQVSNCATTEQRASKKSSRSFQVVCQLCNYRTTSFQESSRNFLIVWQQSNNFPIVWLQTNKLPFVWLIWPPACDTLNHWSCRQVTNISASAGVICPNCVTTSMWETPARSCDVTESRGNLPVSSLTHNSQHLLFPDSQNLAGITSLTSLIYFTNFPNLHPNFRPSQYCCCFLWL